jgi:hypothetical protein
VVTPNGKGWASWGVQKVQKSCQGTAWLVYWMCNNWIQIHGNVTPFICLSYPFQYNVYFTPVRTRGNPDPQRGILVFSLDTRPRDWPHDFLVSRVSSVRDECSSPCRGSSASRVLPRSLPLSHPRGEPLSPFSVALTVEPLWQLLSLRLVVAHLGALPDGRIPNRSISLLQLSFIIVLHVGE